MLIDPKNTKVYGSLIATPVANPMTFAIGQFIVNCGTLEFESYVWIHGFGASDPKNKEDCKKELFAARKARVIRIMNRLAIPAEFKTAVEGLWSEVGQVMEFRNVIAHSPVMVQYNGAEATPEWFIRVIDAKTMGSGNLREYVQDEIDDMTTRVNDLNERLINLRHLIGGGEIKINYTP